jgi:glycine betaine/proline transport system substrate-binding protein
MRKMLLAAVAAVMIGSLVAILAGPRGTASSATPKASKTITIGDIGWDEDVAVNNVVKILLHDKYGYNVTLKLADVGPLYQGVATGSLDAFLDGWLPTTHKIYWARFHSKIILLNSWYKGIANLGLAVPNYVTASSIADLNKFSSKFGGKIVGIEAGAGEMNIVKTKVIPGYGLHLTLVASSTVAMLAALQRALANHQWIVVTLWEPHWAFTKYPIHYLKDPKGEMAGVDHPSIIVRKGLQKDAPQAYKLLKNISLTPLQLGKLELSINQLKDPAKGAQAWIKKNQSLVNSWLK